MALVRVPDCYDFSTVFPTWIIAYCPDTDSWFVSNQRFFYYIYPREFQCEDDAIEYFRNNIPEFKKLNKELYPNKITNDMYLDNTGEKWRNIT